MVWQEFTHCKQFPWRRSFLQCNRKVMTAWQIYSRGKVFWMQKFSFALRLLQIIRHFFHRFCSVFFLINLQIWQFWIKPFDYCTLIYVCVYCQQALLSARKGGLAVKRLEQVLPPSLMMTAHLKVPAGMMRSPANTNRCHGICVPEWLSAIPNYTFDVLTFACGGK